MRRCLEFLLVLFAVSGCSGVAADGLGTDASVQDELGDRRAPVDATADDATCLPVLASDYNQTCAADTDCVLVGQVSACSDGACARCLGWTINKNAVGAYSAAFDRAAAAFPPGEGCACAAPTGPCCRGGACRVECVGPTDAGLPADADVDASPIVDAGRGPVPTLHRAAGQSCPTKRAAGSFPSTCSHDGGLSSACSRDSECSSGNDGRCLHRPFSPVPCATVCSYDECFADSDCPAHEPCDCRSSATVNTANACVTGSECRVDAECGPGGYCSPSAGYGEFNCETAYFCHTPADSCTNDADCDGARCQYDKTGHHWRCGGAGCAPPP